MPLIVIRVDAPTDSIDELVAQYCRYFGTELMFLPTEGFQPPGRRVRFVYALADGREVVWGEGVVTRMRRDSGNPSRPPGMELRYQLLDEASQAVVDRMLALRMSGAQMGRPEPPPYVSMWLEHERDQPLPQADGVETVGAPRVELRRSSRLLWLASAAALLFAVVGVVEIVHHPRARRAPPPRVPVAPHEAPVAPRVELPPPPSPAPPSPAPRSADRRRVLLSLHSQPPDALISVDGEAPALGPLHLFVAPGPHRVVVERQRYASARLEIAAPGHQSIHLSRPPATLRVTTTPPGADVRIDGQLYGVTPLAPTVTAYEQHHVEIALDGQLRHRRVYVKPPLTELEIAFSRSAPPDTRTGRYLPVSARPASP